MAGRDHDVAADEKKKTQVRFVGAAAGIASGEYLHLRNRQRSDIPGSGLTKVGMGHG